MSKCRVFLIRHAESEKNVEDRHGGVGRPLTKKGYRQLDLLVTYLKRLRIHSSTIYYAPITQAELSAEYLASQIGVSCQSDERIRPLNLGVLGGLSRSEAVELYPESAQRLEDWRSGSLDIKDLDIPNAESFDSFWKRGEAFIENLIPQVEGCNGLDFVIIGTRSTLILLTNILLKNSILFGKGYAVYNFDTCSVTMIEVGEKRESTLVFQNKSIEVIAQQSDG